MTIITAVYVDDIIFAVGLKSGCERFRDELNHLVSVKNLGELQWFGGCPHSRDRKRGTLTMCQKTSADELVRKFQVISKQNLPLRVGDKVEIFDEE